MTDHALRRLDPSDMYNAIAAFPDNLREGIEIGTTAPLIPRGRLRRVVILGMGGSAIGGDLLRSYVRSFRTHAIDVQISRGYQSPPVDRSTLVVASSYSGNTEETLAAYDAVAADAGRVLVLTTGGKLAERARREGRATILLPGGLQPRAALAYSFFPLLHALVVGSEIFGPDVRRATEQGISETAELLVKLRKLYSSFDRTGNLAWRLAGRLHGRVPVIYSSSEAFDTVNLRWRGQVQENAKGLAFGNLLPEMNHNEINGWSNPPDLLDRFVAVFLRDSGDHPRVSARMDITRRIIRRRAGDALDVRSRGESLLARMFSLVHLGDWASYYLALMNGADPTPVPIIEGLKKDLAKIEG